MENKEKKYLENLKKNLEEVEEVNSEYLKKYLMVAKMVASGEFRVQEDNDEQEENS